MENTNQDAMMHGHPSSYGSDTGGPLQIPDDRSMMQDDATEDMTRMVSEGADDSADDSASVNTPDSTDSGFPSNEAGEPLGKTNPDDAPVSR